MKGVTYEGVVENGCVHVPAGVTLPEKAKVYIVIPEVIEIETPRVAHIPSPRLARPEQASDFVKEVFETQSALFKLEVTPEETDHPTTGGGSGAGANE
jgi:hypothetical protein